MPTCTAQGIAENSVTVIENIFITHFMPDAPPHAVEVYLFGLYLSNILDDEVNSVTTLMKKLSLTEDEIVEAYAYWEQLGIVIVSSLKPLQVRYLTVKSASLNKKISPGKYSEFNKQIQGALFGRMITPNEFNEYYIFLEESGFEPSALVRVVQYCVELKGGDINYRYILTVARNLARDAKSLDRVNEKLTRHNAFSDDLFEIVKTLKLKRGIDYNDRRFYEKWIEEWGFSFDAVKHAAKILKRGSMERLDKSLEEYYKANAMSAKEMDAYAFGKTELVDCALSLNRIIGVYYQNVDFIVEEYIVKWNSLGFDRATLEQIARYSFKQNIRSLEGLDSTVKRFYKLGLTSEASINRFLETLIKEDELIRQIITELGLLRGVTQYDRRSYRVWQEWGFDFEAIFHVAKHASADYNPMGYMNKILSNYRASGIFKLEEIKQKDLAPKHKNIEKNVSQSKGLEHGYSREELNALFDVLGDVE